MPIEPKELLEWKRRFGSYKETCPHCGQFLFPAEPVTSDPQQEEVRCSRCGVIARRPLASIEAPRAVAALVAELERLHLVEDAAREEHLQRRNVASEDHSVCSVCMALALSEVPPVRLSTELDFMTQRAGDLAAVLGDHPGLPADPRNRAALLATVTNTAKAVEALRGELATLMRSLSP